MAVGAASAAHSYSSQKAAAKAQRQAQANASAVERQRYLNQVSATRANQRQEEIAAAQKIRRAQIQTMEAQATTFTSAGESGVAGLSIDAIQQDLMRQEGQYRQSVDQQLEFSEQARDMALEDAGLGFTSNMLSINKPIEQPDLFGSILSGAQTGLSLQSGMDAAGFEGGSWQNIGRKIKAPDLGTYGVDYGVMNK
jgi:hypothetical protein